MNWKKRPSIPPHSLEAEWNVLSGLLHHNSTWPAVSSILHRGMFYSLPHRHIFETMETLLSSGQALTVSTLTDELRSDDLISSYALAELELLSAPASYIPKYAQIVADRYEQRRLLSNDYSV